MPFLKANQDRAALLVALLGVGLAIGLFPFVTGLLGIPVLYVIFAPVHRRLTRWLRPSIAAGLVVLLAVLLVLGPGAWFVGLVVGEAQTVARNVLSSPVLARLDTLRLGPFELGPRIAEASGKIVSWLAGSVFGIIGTATRLTLNLIISLFGLFYLLQAPREGWEAFRPYIPFSRAAADRLKEQFYGVTNSTVIGTGLTAGLQGLLLWAAFAVIGQPNAAFWGVVTVVFAVLPVVGAGLVWGPAAISLFLGGRTAAGLVLVAWGVVVLGNVENVIRPLVFRRFAQIHPLTTLVGAFAGVPYFGLLGLLVGPLALSYFFELLKMYTEEYLSEPAPLAE